MNNLKKNRLIIRRRDCGPLRIYKKEENDIDYCWVYVCQKGRKAKKRFRAYESYKL